MVSDKDIYADKDGKLTDDPEKFATQVAVAGHELDERVAKRFGITDMLVSTGEPNARRSVRSGGASVHIQKADEKEAAAEEKAADKPETDEPEAKEPKAAASTKKAAAKEEGAKTK